ncbi:MAG: phosphate propanoyltransferase [Clostridiales bacterium]|nr:phosphate propanoyltransferase [Clostridiales bacterium]
MQFIVETSARHCHLADQDLETLFGKGASLSIRKELSQPGQYATNDRVTLVGPKGEMKVTILGPTRKQTQVEISLTDARALGLTPPVRESGDIKGSAPCKLIGPAGELELPEGVIAAKRHIHAAPQDAEKLGVRDKDVVAVRVKTPDRTLIFEDTIVRVNPTYALAMHIDTDEANAAGASGLVHGEIVKG